MPVSGLLEVVKYVCMMVEGSRASLCNPGWRCAGLHAQTIEVADCMSRVLPSMPSQKIDMQRQSCGFN